MIWKSSYFPFQHSKNIYSCFLVLSASNWPELDGLDENFQATVHFSASLINIIIFFLWKKFWNIGIHTQGSWVWSKYANVCAMLPPLAQLS